MIGAVLDDGITYQGTQIIFEEYIVENGTEANLEFCYFTNATRDDAFWKRHETSENDHPFFSGQICFMIVTIQLLFLAFKPLRQPRFLPEMIAGIIGGPTALGRIVQFEKYIFPWKVTEELEALGHLFLVYYMFLVGLEMDLTTIKRIGKKAKVNAIVGIVFPLIMGAAIFYLVAYNKSTRGAAFWGITLTVTSFPDIARILSDMKLLHTDIGRLALSSAFISDLASWALSVTAITVLNDKHHYFKYFEITVFLLFCWFVGRPTMSWIIQRNSSEDGEPNHFLISTVFIGVILCGFITDACGSHSMIGAFMFGLIIPNGDFATWLMEKLEDFITGIMLPAFFMIHGLRFTLYRVLDHDTSVFTAAAAIVLSCSAKIISGFLVSMLYGFTPRQGFTLGILMNTKGVLALIILNAGRNLGGFDQQTFATLTIIIVIVTIMVKPITMACYNSTKASNKHYHNTTKTSKLDIELRVLTCIHSTRNLPGLTALLEVSNSQNQSPVCIFVTHLVQLTERRASTMLIIHDHENHLTTGEIGAPTSSSPIHYHPHHHHHNNNIHSRQEEESDHIINAFKSFENRMGEAMSVQSFTVVSPYDTMHEDVCNLAIDKRVDLILVPFHKQAYMNGKFQDENVYWRELNQNILEKATCSVGIFIDRGGLIVGSDNNIIQEFHFAMVFIGGPDDREALTYAWRMAGHPSVKLSVVRFVQKQQHNNHEENNEDEDIGDDNQQINEDDAPAGGHMMNNNYKLKEQQLDDHFINDFTFRTMCDNSIAYLEKQVDSLDQIIKILGMLGRGDGYYNLYIVGRGNGVSSSLTAGLSEWVDCVELGVLGDSLINCDFAEQSSILVVQQ